MADTNNNRIRRIELNTGWITTVAGNGQAGFSGDGGLGIDATLNHPSGLAVGSTGVLFVADTENHRIRRIGPDSVITTVAGTGSSGFNGDGYAILARLSHPAAVSLDRSGNLYIADTNNSRIRKVSSNGMINTIAGNGDETALATGDGAPATKAALRPGSVAADRNGDVYITDNWTHSIRKVDPVGTLSTVLGRAQPGFDRFSPSSIVLDSGGSLYVADYGQNSVWRITTNGRVSLVAGQTDHATVDYGDGGPATEAELSDPRDLAIDDSGNLYILDSGHRRVRKVNPQGTISTLIIQVSGPSLAVDAQGFLYLPPADGYTVIRVDALGRSIVVAGNGTEGFSGDGGPATQAELRYVSGLAVDGMGNLYISSASDARIRKVSIRTRRRP